MILPWLSPQVKRHNYSPHHIRINQH